MQPFSPGFKGFVKPGIYAKTIGLMMIPFFISDVLRVLSFLIFRGTVDFKPALKVVFMGLSAGFGEEGMLRKSKRPETNELRNQKRSYTSAAESAAAEEAPA